MVESPEKISGWHLGRQSLAKVDDNLSWEALIRPIHWLRFIGGGDRLTGNKGKPVFGCSSGGLFIGCSKRLIRGDDKL